MAPRLAGDGSRVMPTWLPCSRPCSQTVPQGLMDLNLNRAQRCFRRPTFFIPWKTIAYWFCVGEPKGTKTWMTWSNPPSWIRSMKQKKLPRLDACRPWLPTLNLKTKELESNNSRALRHDGHLLTTLNGRDASRPLTALQNYQTGTGGFHQQNIQQ